MPIVDISVHSTSGDQLIGTLAKMEVHAGPGPLVGLAAQPSAHRVQLDVSHRREQMFLVHNERMKALLPKMTLPAIFQVGATRIARMRSPQQAGQRVCMVRDQNQMDVVGHQAIREYVHFGFWQLFGEQIKVRGVVGVNEERRLPAAASLGNMMRVFRYH
jgi:hypothetical protein